MLSAIVAVTLLVPDLAAAERAYRQELGYQTVARGQIATEHAAGWGAPALSGRDYALLQPASGEPVYLRMVATDASPAPALKALGPVGELLYFTRMPAGKSKFGLGSASSFVDRVFIVVVGPSGEHIELIEWAPPALGPARGDTP